MKSGSRNQAKRYNGANRAEIDELLGFLPKLRSAKGKYTIKDAGIEKNSAGELLISGPEYTPLVIEFFRIAGKACWSDREYEPEKTAQMFENRTLIKKASLDQIRTMLTWCVRGERFCDGHWATVLSSGRIFALLERLKEIRKSGN